MMALVVNGTEGLLDAHLEPQRHASAVGVRVNLLVCAGCVQLACHCGVRSHKPYHVWVFSTKSIMVL